VYLQTHGATVEVTDDAERATFRAERGVPDEAASCHTAVIEGYTLEGHIPVEAIARLLADQPDAVGLALPGMPADSPGMGGDTASWRRQPVMLIGADGGLTEYDY